MGTKEKEIIHVNFECKIRQINGRMRMNGNRER